MRNSKRRILALGQTPPPFNGQAIMIEKMVNGHFDKIEFVHVRMSMSKDVKEVGKFRLAKIFEALKVVYKALYYRYKYQVEMLYYPPAGPQKIPFYRDVLILLLIRPFFKKLCFHFHAAGLSELYPNLSRLNRFFFKKAYYAADLGIRMSLYSTDDCSKIKVKQERIIPYGIEDKFCDEKSQEQNKVPRILFVGLLSRSKGIIVLINACRLLKDGGLTFSVDVVGQFDTPELEVDLHKMIIKNDLERNINILGLCVGEEKFKVYQRSDIFCFPSSYENESFPVVLLEASCFALPIVSTMWRGIPSIVTNGENGFLVSPNNYVEVAEKLEALITNPGLRERMGKKAREVYIERYTMEKFYRNIEDALSNI